MRHDQASKVVAVLGPTNTGKTHYAIERMLAHGSGIIGLPLRLLAREVFDRIVAVKGPDKVALITGEERILPKDARYRVCTVEAMPRGHEADFLAVDEIQLSADPERGHVFTDRLLHARGRFETLFLGSETLRGAIRALLPEAEIVTRPRFSDLSHVGGHKLSRLPRRSAIVAFSAEEVYALAELVRRQRGGAAVVMGALSPRTRNAQVALYQSGEVDFLVATDAIGMGLNMDIDHVAFASLRKFDGAQHRALRPHEIGQIAGRAGRHVRNGTFGTTADAGALDPDVIERVENHSFDAVKALMWRNVDLDFATPKALIASLEMPPPRHDLSRAREADDLLALKALLSDPDVAARAKGGAGLRLLWDVCQVPDFARVMAEEHARLLARLFDHVSSPTGRVPKDWIAQSLDRLDDVAGDIDTLAHRLSHVRTWTFITHRDAWLEDAAHWQARAREVEDRLSDALHERLTLRFVDRRTSVLMQRLRQREVIEADIDPQGDVLVAGEFVGRLNGFLFEPDPRAGHAGQTHARTLKAAALPALRRALAARAQAIAASGDEAFELNGHGRLVYGGASLARLVRGPGVLKPRIEVLCDDLLDARERLRVEERLGTWLDQHIAKTLGTLARLEANKLSGLARGIAFRLVETLGVLPRLDDEVIADLRALAQDERAALRRLGVVFGESAVHVPALLKPAATRMKLVLWAVHRGVSDVPPPPPPGLVTISIDPDVPRAYYAATGFRPFRTAAVRIDMLERVSQLARAGDEAGAFPVSPEMMSLLGAGADVVAEVLEGLGYRAEPAGPVEGEALPATLLWRRKVEARARRRAAPAIPESSPVDTPFAALAVLKRGIGS